MGVNPSVLSSLGNCADGMPHAASRFPDSRSWVIVSGFW